MRDGFIVGFHVQEQITADDLEGKLTGTAPSREDGSPWPSPRRRVLARSAP